MLIYEKLVTVIMVQALKRRLVKYKESRTIKIFQKQILSWKNKVGPMSTMQQNY